MKVYPARGILKPELLSGVFTLCLAMSFNLGAEPLVNGGGETGNLNGWIASSTQRIKSSTSLVQTTGTVVPHGGSRFFAFAGAPGTFETLEQSGLIDVGANTILFTGYFQSERLTNIDGDDFGEVLLQGLNGAGEVVVENTSGRLAASNTLQWESFAVSLFVPGSVVRWKVILRGTRLFGTYINVFYDDLNLTFTDTGLTYDEWAAARIGNPSLRGTLQDADADGQLNLVEYGCFLDTTVSQDIQPFWIKRGSEVSPTDVDLFYRQSLDATGITYDFLYSENLTAPFLPVSGRGPYVVASGAGYIINRIRVEEIISNKAFFRMRLSHSPD